MHPDTPSRREMLKRTGGGVIAAAIAGAMTRTETASAQTTSAQPTPHGDQRLSLEQLRQWEALTYGMFIHFGMSTFLGKELPDGNAPATTYAPDELDVDQWISVARDAGMRYAVLTAKHVAGHCLWPSKHTDYTVVNSGDTTDVCEAFVKACDKHGVKAGFYYCSWDNHNRFGSRTPSDTRVRWPANAKVLDSANLPPYTTSLYQDFQTAQVTELLTQYGPIVETWIDIPPVLGPGYRTFLYHRIAELQPETIIMMNNGIGPGDPYPFDRAWPGDIIAIERRLPPETGHRKWREHEGKRYYMPGEVCDPIGKDWFYVAGDAPRSDDELLKQFQACRQRGVNLLLDVPPDKHGRIPDEHVQALMRLRKNARL